MNAETSQFNLPFRTAVQQLYAGNDNRRALEPLEVEHRAHAPLHAPTVLPD
jgi:hypothetical protein